VALEAAFPTSLGWLVTNKCNLQCRHCIQTSGSVMSDELTTAEALHLIDHLRQEGLWIIDFTGGEPLCRQDIFELNRRAVKAGIRTILTTNGTMLTDRLIQEQLIRFSKVRVSLDSTMPDQHDRFRGIPGAWERTIRALERLRWFGIKTTIITTVAAFNLAEFEELVTFIPKLGVFEWMVSVFVPGGRGKEMREAALTPDQFRSVLERLLLMKQKYPHMLIKTDFPHVRLLDATVPGGQAFCSAAMFSAVMLPNGDIGPCFSMPIVAGNIRHTTLREIWNTSEVFRSCRNKTLLKGKCGLCHLRDACGGCRAFAYSATGDHLEGDPMCWYDPLAIEVKASETG